MFRKALYNSGLVVMAVTVVAACGKADFAGQAHSLGLKSSDGKAKTSSDPEPAPPTSPAPAGKETLGGGEKENDAATDQANNKTGENIHALVPADAGVYSALKTGSTIYVGTSAGLFVSTDGTKTFKNLTGVTAASPRFYVTAIAVDQGKIYIEYATKVSTANLSGTPNVFSNFLAVSSDQGATFTDITLPTGVAINKPGRLRVVNGTVYLCAGGVNYSADGGQTWQPIGVSGCTDMALTGSSAYVANDTKLLLSTDAFAHTTEVALPTVSGKKLAAANTAYPLYAAGSQIFLIYGSGQTASNVLLRSDDNGSTFATVATPTIAPNYIAGSGSLISVIDSFYLGVSKDGGQTFQRPPAGLLAQPNMRCLEVDASANEIYACGRCAGKDGLAVTHDGGDTFECLAFTNTAQCTVQPAAQGLPRRCY